MKNNLHGVYFTEVLREMCNRVDVNYEDIDFKKDNWYEDYTWSTNDQNKFIEWFAKYLRNMGPRRELCKYPSLTRTIKQRIKFAEKFVPSFSWKIK